MTIYWLLFFFAAIMALTYRVDSRARNHVSGQEVGYLVFLVFYSLVGLLRYQIGGDWMTYDWMFRDIQGSSLEYSLTRTDPAFGLLMWISAQLGTGVYLVNGVACLILIYGITKVARKTREPWLAIVAAVPYILIVVGLGYVRQAAAIGMILLAMAAIERGSIIKVVTSLIVAAGFHSTAVIFFPVLAIPLIWKRGTLSLVIFFVSLMTYYYFLSDKVANLESGYLGSEYDSGGALVRLSINAILSLIIILRWKYFSAGKVVRPIWFGIAVVNILLMGALYASPSSTAVDRVGLYFSIVQIAFFGEINNILESSYKHIYFRRFLSIAFSASVMVIWLFFATHSWLWVPYDSIFSL